MYRIIAFSADSSRVGPISRPLHGSRRIFVSCVARALPGERCAAITTCLRVVRNSYSQRSILDVWSVLSIVSQPDTHVGRRGSILSVCEHARSYYLPPPLICCCSASEDTGRKARYSNTLNTQNSEGIQKLAGPCVSVL